MRMRSSISALLPFHLRAWPSHFCSSATPYFRLSNLALLHLRLIGESVKVQTAQTGHDNKRHLNYILHWTCVPFTLDGSHIRTFAFKRRYESIKRKCEVAKLINAKFESKHLHIRECRLLKSFFSAYIWKRCRNTHVPKRTDPETLMSFVIVRGNRISLLWHVLKTKVACNLGWFDTMDYFLLACYILRR